MWAGVGHARLWCGRAWLTPAVWAGVAHARYFGELRPSGRGPRPRCGRAWLTPAILGSYAQAGVGHARGVGGRGSRPLFWGVTPKRAWATPAHILPNHECPRVDGRPAKRRMTE